MKLATSLVLAVSATALIQPPQVEVVKKSRTADGDKSHKVMKRRRRQKKAPSVRAPVHESDKVSVGPKTNTNKEIVGNILQWVKNNPVHTVVVFIATFAVLYGGYQLHKYWKDTTRSWEERLRASADTIKELEQTLGTAQKVEEEHPEAEDGWEVVKTKKTNKRAPKPRVVPTEAEDNPAQEEVAAPVEIPAVVQEEEVQPEEEAQSEDIDASEPQIISETAENAEEECLLQECADEFPEFSDESDWSEDGSDAGDWITPENLHRMDVAVGHEDDVKVACITGDYSAQNVLLQIGLSVMTFDGYAVKNVKIWGLVCRACCHFTRDSTKQFCAKCGHAMMMRVPITVDGEGRVTLHHHKRKANLKGTIYAIPKNRGGREANNLILAEDQMMMGGRDRMLRQKQKLYEKERQMRSLDSDTCLITKGWDFRQTTKNGNHVIQYGAPKVQIGYGRKNPNANNFRKKNK